MHTPTRRITLTALAVASTAAMAVGCSTSNTTADDRDDRDTGDIRTVAVASENTVRQDRLSAQAAATAAEAALASCAADDLGSVSVSVVDRDGQLQAFTRGDGAAEHTVEASRLKAYTAAAFGADTGDLVERADDNDLHRLPGTLFMPGGVSVKVDDSSIAGIGVGGAPSGMDDQSCAAAGLEAIADAL
ncbi:GlcG/HbpS family heme-binding protein [Corynebacterium kalidii]|uniref:Heme-binding protein n=1 Tax=Corynebacterium kalidii TaxID=2931982 RepID=A0A9X2AZJ1_9CORY|nr:heme-binding protein [Corynebacterium kalidii]MCJ7858883.1 heme-binding protein [Corynebacterium kalidii]